jgi:glycosyltransferase involved in cell wall biosynthesis
VTGGGECVSQIESSGAEHRTLFLDTSSELNPRLFVSAAKLRGWVEREGWQILHAQTRVTQGVSLLALAGLGVPRVTTCHGFFKTRFFRRLFPWWGSRVIAISRAVERHLVSDWRLDPARVAYVPHGVEKIYREEDLAALRQEARRELNLLPGTVLVGTLGRLSPVKGYHILVEAMALLGDLPVELALVGDGAEAPRLEHSIHALGLGAKVRRIPAITNHHVILHAFDIFCAPSLQEGLGLSVLDAMARGTAVAASRVGGLPDLIRDGETGRLVSPGDPAALAAAIRELASDPQGRSRMGTAARRFVEREFPLNRMIEETERVYNEAVRP